MDVVGGDYPERAPPVPDGDVGPGGQVKGGGDAPQCGLIVLGGFNRGDNPPVVNLVRLGEAQGVDADTERFVG